jgi:tripartite-type tricarboxylate transporter receptor subunit TctC
MKLLAAAALGIAAFAGSAQAADFPTKPVTFVVPFSPGGSNDIVGRQLSKQLSEIWGQPVVVENRPGAGATVGSAHVAAQPADGYTITIASVTFTMNPAVQKSLPFDPEKDFTRIGLIGQVPLVIGARPGIPADSPQEFFDYLKSNPGSLNYGATGVGSIQHFAGELLNQAVGSDVQVVQYPGGGPAMTDVMGDHIEYSIGSMTQMLPQIRAGNIKPIAVTSSERSDAAPDVPTLQEAGLEDYEVLQWWGVLAPAGVPDDIVSKLNADINQVLESQEMKDFLAAEGGAPRPMSQPEFAEFMQANFDRWKKVAEAANITAE